MAENPEVTIPTPAAPPNTDVQPGQAGAIPPPPAGASDTPPANTAAPAGASDTPPSTENGQPESTLGKVVDTAEDVSSGFGNALMETVHGIGAGLKKIPQVALAEKLSGHELIPQAGLDAEKKGTPSPEGAAQWVGYGGENLAEFMLGDDALKGLSMADKFKQISGAMGILEKSPRLMRAIQMGADIGKATGELSDEARAVIQKNPMLARLVGAGMDAIRQGVVQGAQTTAKTGGDVGEGAKAGITQGVTSGVLGGAFGLLGRATEKAGEAGKAVEEASAAGKNAPTSVELGQKVSDQINDAETKMHGDFESGIQKLKGDLGNQKVPYAGSPLQKAAQDAVQGKSEITGYHGTEANYEGPPKTDGLGAHFSTDRTVAESHTLATGDKARVIESNLDIKNPLRIKDSGGSHSAAISTISDFVKQGVLPATFKDGLDARIMSAVDKGIPWQEANDQELSKVKDYLKSKGYDGLVYKNTVEGGGDSYVAFDAKQIKPGGTAAPVLGKEFNSLVGGSNESKNLIQSLADPKKTGDLTIDELVQRRQQLGEKIGQLTKGATNSADRADVQVYQKLRDGIDDTIEGLAKQSGKPEASQDYDALRAAYKDKVKLFQSPAMQAMSAPGVASDMKLDNAAKYLLQGGNKLDKINTLSETIGEPAVKDLGKGIIQQRLAAASSESGQVNPAKFVKNFKDIDNLPPEVKEKLFDMDGISGDMDKLSKNLKSAANYQKLVRAGLIGGASAAGGAAGHAVHTGGEWGAIPIVLSLAGEKGSDLLDKIANRPGMWSAFRKAGAIGATLEESPAARRVGSAVKYGAGNALGNVLGGATEPLSQPEDQTVYTNQ